MPTACSSLPTLWPAGLLVGFVASVLAACAPPAPVAAVPRVAAPALSALPVARLLPRSSVSGPPTPAPTAVPAFDRAHVTALDAGESYSIGTTRHGYLMGAVALDASAGLARRPVSVTRSAIYGTAGLVGLLGRAAAAVQRHVPGSVLYAGDLSAAGGGDLPGHESHNSGRDADLAFYRRDVDGALGDTPVFSDVSADLRSGHAVFDLERNWLLVASMLRDPSVSVQWIFIANPLRDALLAYATEAGADEELIRRAERVLAQPSDSSPHRDHFHVRIYCGEEEALEGCLDAAPYHPWISRWDEEVERLVAGYLPLLQREGPAEVRLVIERLVRLNAASAVPALEALARSADPELAALATEAVDFLRGDHTPAAWARWRSGDVGE